jgi:hypothetical protein
MFCLLVSMIVFLSRFPAHRRAGNARDPFRGAFRRAFDLIHVQL